MLSKEETVLLLKPTSRDVWSGGGVGGRERRERETAADTGEVIPDSCVARAGIKGVAGP